MKYQRGGEEGKKYGTIRDYSGTNSRTNEVDVE